MTVPIENIYYLLCYAWNHAQETRRIEAGGEEFERIYDLLGHVLARTAGGLLKSGLHRDYVTREGALAGIRGKLMVSETARQHLLWAGRTYCQFDEFTHDILPNQLIKSTLRRLLKVPTLDHKVRAELRAIVLHMQDVCDVSIGRRDFNRIVLNRNNRGYDFALRLCRILHESILVDHSTGKAAFHDFSQDEARMGQVFEEFLFNFLRLEQQAFSVSRPHIDWHGASGSIHDLQRLPIMRTDIVLRRPGTSLVIDAKFYKEGLAGNFGKEKVRSGHLYQIFTYLQNLRPIIAGALEGMLLYPVVEKAFSYDYRLHGHRIRVATVNLDQSWQGVRADLLELIRN